MEQRRFLVFFLISMAIWMAWINFVVPMIFPDFNKPPAKGQKLELKVPETSEQSPNAESVDAASALTPENVRAAAAAPEAPEIPKHASMKVLVGPTDPDKDPAAPSQQQLEEFFLATQLNSEGAAVDFVELTDKARYPAFGRRHDRARVIGSEDAQRRSRNKTTLKTFSLQSPQIDKLLGGSSLDRINWEFIPEADAADSLRTATFQIVSPDKVWELTKRYEIKQLTHDELKQSHAYQTLLDGYKLTLKITIRNLTDKPQQFNYTLQGPVGVPLEDAENSYKFRDIRMGFLRDDGKTLDERRLSASETVKKEKSDKTEIWKPKLKYIGIDVLYFAALILPENPNQIDSSKAVVANETAARVDHSDISVQLTSPSIDVEPNGQVTNEFALFAGPKHRELMAKIPAMALMDYGWFDALCYSMIWLLKLFHSIGLSYGVAIICLTVLVRTALLPISKRQAANAARMKELQPKLAQKQKDLETKYGKGTDEYMQAVQELSKEQFGLMASGCLPMFLQLPIFIALYRAIGSSIELRMEPFLWFENLASPDALFKLPFTVPWFGWTDFNLLPCISTALMFIHQKLTMPPATNEEQAQQQKMMSYMMIFMGAMFFRVPSGLCLYFIATNIWSMTERWIFDKWKKTPPVDESSVESITPPSNPLVTTRTEKSREKAKEPEKPSVLGSWWEKMQQAADEQRSASRQLDRNTSNRDDRKKKKR